MSAECLVIRDKRPRESMSVESLVTGDERPGEIDGLYDKRPVLVKRLLYQKRKGSMTHFLFSAEILI